MITVTSHDLHGFSNHRQFDWLFNRSFSRGSIKENIKAPHVWPRPHFYQTRSAWSVDQGSNKNHSPAYNFAPTVTKFCVMWEGLSLPHDTKFGNCRCKIVDSRAFPSWSLIHGLRWSGLIKAEPDVSGNHRWRGRNAKCVFMSCLHRDWNSDPYLLHRGSHLCALRWRHINVMLFQITGHATVCLPDHADPHQRNIKVRITGLWGKFTSDQWIPRTKGPVARKNLPFDCVIVGQTIDIVIWVIHG